MLAILIAFPVFLTLIVIQSAIVSAAPLLHGNADLILLTIIAWALQERVKAIWQWAIIGGMIAAYFSKSPFFLTLLAYLAVTAIVVFVRNKIRGMPYLAMLAMTFLGTVFIQGLSLLARWFEVSSISVLQAFNLIILPSLLLNILLAIPVFAIVKDFANWLYPVEVSV